MRVGAIIVAAGGGTRLGVTEPKAFVDVGGKCLLLRTAETLNAVASLASLAVVVPPGEVDRARRLLDPILRPGLTVGFTVGGRERQDSVRHGLLVLPEDCEIVVVHDAARPFATAPLVAACVETAASCGAAVAAVPACDTVKEVDARGLVVRTLDRSVLWLVQTPQAFRGDLLREVHARALADQLLATDDAGLFEHYGYQVWAIRGDERNLKITTPADLELARALVGLLAPR